MEIRELKVKKLPHFVGELPVYETPHASGFDIRARLDHPLTLKSYERALIPTGLAFEIPIGFELQVRPRSGWAFKKGVTLLNSPGTIDADYRGEVKIIIINFGEAPVTIRDQDRIAQLVFTPVMQVSLVLSESLSQTIRAEGGFGSTGSQ